MEGVTITAGAQAAVRQPSTPASGRGDAARRRLVRHSTLPSNAERLEYEPSTQLPQSGLVQHQISVAIPARAGVNACFAGRHGTPYAEPGIIGAISPNSVL